MAKQTINLGTVANDGTGDSLRTMGAIVNDNFTELYDGVGSGINTQTGTSYTLQLSDRGKYISCSNASAIAVTVPKNSVVAFTVGTVIVIEQRGAGQVTISPVDGDVTINAYDGKKTAGQYAVIQLKKVATDTWICIGGVS